MFIIGTSGPPIISNNVIPLFIPLGSSSSFQTPSGYRAVASFRAARKVSTFAQGRLGRHRFSRSRHTVTLATRWQTKKKRKKEKQGDKLGNQLVTSGRWPRRNLFGRYVCQPRRETARSLMECELNRLRKQVSLQETTDLFKVMHIQADVEKMSSNSRRFVSVRVTQSPRTLEEY